MYKVTRTQVADGAAVPRLLKSNMEYDEALQYAIQKAENITRMLLRIEDGWMYEPHDNGASIFLYEDVMEVFEVVPEEST